jgi:DNA-binding IclR family transcriptional regulator
VRSSKVKVLDKALTVFSLFSKNDELSIKELTEMSGLNRTTIYRILQVFLDWDFLEQDPATKKYRTSLKVLEIAGSVLRTMSFLKIARPSLLRLRDLSGESSYLGVLDAFNIVIVDLEQSYFDARIDVTMGKAVPSHCTASGKAILAFLPPDELDLLLSKNPLIRHTENTITDKSEFRAVLRETEKKGYAVSREEYDYNILVVAAPIFNIRDEAIASCAIAALKSRIKDEQQIEGFGEMVRKEASEISKKLGSSKRVWP